MPEAYIVAAVRTPGGRRDGGLREWHPADLGGLVLDEVIRRGQCPGELVDDVIFGCVSQVGAQSGNIARSAVLSSSLPESVPGTTVDRQCGSSQQAIHFAAQAVMSGTQDIVIAGGVEVMSKVPIGANVVDGLKAGHGHPFQSEGLQERYPGVVFSQFAGAEMIAQRWGMTREEIDAFSCGSHRKAAAATESGRFGEELLPTRGASASGEELMVTADEGIRYDCSVEGLAGLKVLNEDGGVLTAGSSSQITDGAAAVMIVNEEGLKKLGVQPLARFVSLALAGDDPVIMLTGPIPATRTALERAGLKIGDIACYEVNEAFAPVPMAWQRELDADMDRLNVNGGAIALGHPLGCTGAKLMTTLVHELHKREERYGLQAICEGGGTANACIVERC